MERSTEGILQQMNAITSNRKAFIQAVLASVDACVTVSSKPVKRTGWRGAI